MKCDYCGEYEALEEIDNPNEVSLGETKPWRICGWCAKVIPLQREESLYMLTKTLSKGNKAMEEMADKQIEEIKQKIREISMKSGMPTYSIELTKKE